LKKPSSSVVTFRSPPAAADGASWTSARAAPAGSATATVAPCSGAPLLSFTTPYSTRVAMAGRLSRLAVAAGSFSGRTSTNGGPSNFVYGVCSRLRYWRTACGTDSLR
jgi:hypothetical protein